MQTGFEVTAAVPKRLRAAEDQPAAESMRGERKITQAPSTDQKKVRRQMQRKTADLDTEAKVYGEESRISCPDCGAKERKQKWTGFGSSGGQRNYGWACGSCGHHYSAPVVQERTGSAGHVEEHDGVQARDEFDTEHVEPGGGHHHHSPRTAMDYTALMNDVGDCRSCGGDLVKQPGQRGESTVKANCADCGMEHSLQDNSRATASLRTLNANLRAVQAIHEVDNSPCPDCGSKGWATKNSNGHSAGSHGSDGKPYWNWHVKCRDCGHRYEVPREDRADRYASLSWEPSPDPKYLSVNPMSAIARRAHAVLAAPEENP